MCYIVTSYQSVIGILTPKMKILTLEPYTAVNRSSSEHVSCYESGFHSLRIFVINNGNVYQKWKIMVLHLTHV